MARFDAGLNAPDGKAEFLDSIAYNRDLVRQWDAQAYAAIDGSIIGVSRFAASTAIAPLGVADLAYSLYSGETTAQQLLAGSAVGLAASVALHKPVGALTAKLGGAERGGARMFSSGELMGVERASPDLIASVSGKRSVVIAREGSDELRMLDYFGAEASVNTAENGILNGSIILRQNPSKAAVLEEFLHGTQARLGITDRLGTSGLGSAETHVKDFMIRHQGILGLGKEDVAILKILRDKGL